MVEMVGIFVVLPIVMWFGRHILSSRVIATILAVALFCLIVLLRDPTFDRRRLYSLGRWKQGLQRILVIFIPAALALAVVVAFLLPERFLGFPRSEPRFWAVVMVAYPVFSVYPQELIFRTFFFHRYRELLPSMQARIFASAVAFGLAHLFFGNWLAPVMSTAGGWLFARTYARSGSTLQCSVEHALWGDAIFTIGLGWYFYGGSIAG